MKAKLIKTESGYNLFTQGFLKASTETDLINQMNIEEVNIRYHLSKQNCDEIFGVVNVENLAENHPLEVSNASHGFGIKDGIVYGFNKALELNKNKVFTLSDMKRAFNCGRDLESIDRFEDWRTFTHFINSLQPTEIEVEVEMINSRTGKIVNSESDLEWDENGLCDMTILKLDESECLILKRI